MGGGEFPGRWQNVLGNGVEDSRILSEDADIKDLLRLAEPEMFELGIETSFGSEVRDA